MTNESLAGYSNLSLYSAMAVFTIAMVCHGADWRTSVPSVATATAGMVTVLQSYTLFMMHGPTAMTLRTRCQSVCRNENRQMPWPFR